MPQSITTYLANDHGRLIGLFHEFQKANRSNLEARRKRFKRFRRAMNLHGRWVDTVLLDRLKDRASVERQERLNGFLSREQVHFEDQLKAIEKQLDDPSTNTEELEAQLLSSLKSHFTQEEKILYPMFDQHLDEEEKEQLIDRFDREREEMET